jgi:predicted membrane-bound spermidine synthase
MSTTTHDQGALEEISPEIAASGKHIQGWLRIILVFVAGAASLTIEMAASRLLAPYFGSSLFVWANLIGLILLYLTIGYYVGGVLADRQPYPRIFYAITAIAALLIGMVPLIAPPILTWAFNTFATYSLGIFYGSLVSIICLFALPTILLGCVSPYAIRLSIEQLGRAGRTAGMLYAISTAGSIVGTFVPVLVLLPDLGTNLTFIICAAILLLTSSVALVVTESLSRKK